MMKRPIKLSWLATVICTSVGFLAFVHPSKAAPATIPQTDSALECLFRYMSKNHDRPVHGISMDGISPSPEFMQRFMDAPAIEPLSAIDANPRGYTDKKTHKPADIYTAETDSIKWLDQNSMTIEASAHASGLDGYVGTYTIVHKDGKWKVASYKDSGIMF